MPGSVLSKRVRLAHSTDPLATSDVAIAGRPSADPRQQWLEAFREVRAETERRASFLSPEDQVVQSMPDASPTKWHRAHVTWFFEQFLLKSHVKNYRPFDERFGYLYNSYYVSAGPRAARPQRGLVTRRGGDHGLSRACRRSGGDPDRNGGRFHSNRYDHHDRAQS
jgi:hypothetical protein